MPFRLILSQRNLSRKLRTVIVQIQIHTPLFVPHKLNWTVLLLNQRYLKFYLSQSPLYIIILQHEINDLNVTQLHLLMYAIFGYLQWLWKWYIPRHPKGGMKVDCDRLMKANYNLLFRCKCVFIFVLLIRIWISAILEFLFSWEERSEKTAEKYSSSRKIISLTACAKHSVI